MSWLKQSDVSANHPITLRALEMENADDRILNEVYGWVNRCATQSAAFDQDYIVTIGTARAMAGSFARFEALAAAAIFCGYFTEVMITVEGEKRKAFKLVEEEDLFHMILKAEKDWTKQRQADNRNVAKTGPVRLRDGDACRYCGRVVGWGADKKSVRWGSIDHVVPGEEGTVATMVVCCGECNSRRKNDPNSIWKTLPPPAEPLIGPATARWLTEKCGIPTQPTYTRIPTEHVSPAPASGVQVFEDPHAEQPVVAVSVEDEATVATPGLPSDLETDTLDGAVEELGATDASPAPAISVSPAPASGVEVFEDPHAEQPVVAVSVEDEATVATPGLPSDLETGTLDGAVENMTATEQQPAIKIKTKIKTDRRFIRDEQSGRSGYAGSGRDGSGWVGQGRVGNHVPACHDPAAKSLGPPNLAGIPKPSAQGKKNRRRTKPRKNKRNPNV